MIKKYFLIRIFFTSGYGVSLSITQVHTRIIHLVLLLFEFLESVFQGLWPKIINPGPIRPYTGVRLAARAPPWACVYFVYLVTFWQHWENISHANRIFVHCLYFSNGLNMLKNRISVRSDNFWLGGFFILYSDILDFVVFPNNPDDIRRFALPLEHLRGLGVFFV